jgi:hypothetical protein
MSAEEVRVEANFRNPARDKPSILPGGHAAAAITTTGEKKLAQFLASGFDVIVNGLPRLLRQLKPRVAPLRGGRLISQPSAPERIASQR